MLDERKWTVLRALIEENIRTGEPVSSSAILAASGLEVSSATIRNDLQVLEADGFATQPHPSAGRVPTDKGFRYYVDNSDPGQLRRATRDRIQHFFDSIHRELRSLLKETSGLLADVSHYPAVVVGPGLAGESVRGVHLVQTGDQAVLLVIVTESGRVSQELVRLPRAISAVQIEEAEAILAGRLVGKTLEEEEAESASGLSPQVVAMLEALTEAAARAGARTRDVYVGGTSHLAELWADLGKVQSVLELLEHESELLDLVEQGRAGTNVLIGAEVGARAEDVAIVSAAYGGEGKMSGRVAVLGPMRMNYRRTIRLVEEVGEGLTDSLG